MTHSGENNKENETMRIHDDEEDEDDNEDEEDRNNEDDGPWMDEPILFLDQFQLPQELLGSGCPTKYQPEPVLSFLLFQFFLLSTQMRVFMVERIWLHLNRNGLLRKLVAKKLRSLQKPIEAIPLQSIA